MREGRVRNYVLLHAFLMRVKNIRGVCGAGEGVWPNFSWGMRKRWPALEGKSRPGGCPLDARVVQSISRKGASGGCSIRWGTLSAKETLSTQEHPGHP